MRFANSSLPIYGSLSIGCRIRFSEDFHLHICHDEPLLFRRKAEKRMVELSPNEVRLMREVLFAFRNKLLSAGKPTEDVSELIIKVMRWTIMKKIPTLFDGENDKYHLLSRLI